MPDTPVIDPLAEPASPEESAARPPRKKASAKKVSAKAAKTRQPRRASKGAARETSSVPVKVGGDTISMPKALATNLTSKDLKRLRAVLKRVRKRGKRAARKTAKKSGAKKG